jgi:hypothetical protein
LEKDEQMQKETFKPKVRAIFDAIKSLMVSEGLYYVDFKTVAYIDPRLGPVVTLTLRYNVVGDPIANVTVETAPPADYPSVVDSTS